MISKPILDISIPEKEKVTFECEVSRTNADVKWYKVRNYFVTICRVKHQYLKSALDILQHFQ